MAEHLHTEVTALEPCGMILLRGDLEAEWAPDLLSIMGYSLPEQRQVIQSEAGAALWFSPDELMLLCEAGSVAEAVVQMQSACREAQAHALVADISDARARFAISGPGARLTLSKLCPVDLSEAGFGPGHVRRTRIAQVACAFWMTGPESFELICFRSVSEYVEGLLRNAARSHMGLEML
ncbi:MAG: sarcosine oxidase subunit gamma [Mangrovicoccus sp.]|nr:sarcosine oxidase subunit gamma [Mangrovicoccus sp.]